MQKSSNFRYIIYNTIIFINTMSVPVVTKLLSSIKYWLITHNYLVNTTYLSVIYKQKNFTSTFKLLYLYEY